MVFTSMIRKVALLLAAIVLASCFAEFAFAAEPQTFDSGGVKIRYFVEGSGPPVVLLHGLHSSAKMNWDLPGITAMLAKDYQVITLDLRGHGGSDKPDGEDKYGVELAEDVIRLLDHLKLDKAHIVGYSMGGMIAVELLVKHPDRVSSAALGGMGWMKEGGTTQKVWERLGARPTVLSGATPNGLVASLGKLAVTEDELKGIKVPVEMIVGDKDPVKTLYVTPASQVRKDWPVVEIPDAGHIACVTKPQFKEALQKWLAKQTKPAK